jgi:hypothetical protein
MRETRSSGSAEGVIGNCDPYSDPPEHVVVNQSLLGSREPTLLGVSSCPITSVENRSQLPTTAQRWTAKPTGANYLRA